MGLSTLAPDRAGWTWGSISEDFNISFFERSNHTITFPEGIGVVSDEMVRFQTNWTIAGGEACSAQITYRFDAAGNLCYMEYRTNLDADTPYTAYIEIFNDTAQEIDAILEPYAQNLVVRPFSWTADKEKYTGGGFNIRESQFVNNGDTPISDPVAAARLALREYSNLGEYLSIEVFRDETMGMWKVTIEAYVEYQSTYAYRDIYLSDSGSTQLLVYEDPIGWNETRK
ncbi:MAG: hypothetical protein J6V25_12350 [Oscillospiraceae bacterium]|nr:hypothetical protein [Oscillospiraceae bacterium]